MDLANVPVWVTENNVNAAYAVANGRNNNGPGDPRTVIVDVTALGNGSSVTQLILQSDSDLTKGPQPLTLTPSRKLSVTPSGYGTACLHIVP
jgi:hypothetical protein